MNYPSEGEFVLRLCNGRTMRSEPLWAAITRGKGPHRLCFGENRYFGRHTFFNHEKPEVHLQLAVGATRKVFFNLFRLIELQTASEVVRKPVC